MASDDDYGTSKDPLKDYVYPTLKSISGTQYDVARKEWGSTWRMPTYDEMNELLTKCTTTWTTQDGVKGYKIIGPNGNSIFLPSAGYKTATILCNGPESTVIIGYYWTGTPRQRYATSANILVLHYDEAYSGASERSMGHTVRPVTE